VVVEYQKRLQCRGGCPLGSIGSELAGSNSAARPAVASGYLRCEPPSGSAGLEAMHRRSDLDGNPAELGLDLLTVLQRGLLITQIMATVRR
jgi:TetR/AcrR family transcriptional repressor of nem operon